MTLVDGAEKRAALTETLRRQAQRRRPIPLSLPQRRLWLLAELDRGGATYNIPLAFRLHGELDVGALEAALNAMVRRHDVLRAVVDVTDGEPAYVVDETFRLELHRGELLSDEGLQAALVRESGRTFDLRAAPAIRANLFRVGEHDHVLLVTLHHIVTDGWSTSIIQHELGLLYEAQRNGSPAPLGELACTYADFSEWQRRRLAAGELDDSIRYWTEQLRDAPPLLDVAPGRTAQRGTSAVGSQRVRILSAATCRGLDRLCVQHGTTRFAVLLAAFTALLHRYTGQSDMIVGSAIANRTELEFEGLIGFFVNTLPLRVQVEDDPTFDGWLAAVHAVSLDAFEHQDVPFQTLIEAVHPERSGARTPLINVMFALQNAPETPLMLTDLIVSPLAVERTTAKFDLTLEVTQSASDLIVALEYRTDLFEKYAVDALLDAFEILLSEIVRDSARPLSHFPIVSALSERQQLVDWNATARPLSDGRIERLFERQAELVTQNVAVVDGNHRLSYREVNQRANRLAHYLRLNGVVSQARVGLCFRRGADMIVAMLAILKAGAAYVPIDPSYPVERLQLLLLDAQIAIVLTDTDGTFLESAELRVLVCNGEPTWLNESAVSNLRLDGGSGSDLACVIYTSGSAGRPKGVLISHAGIERLVSDPNYVELRPTDVVAQASTIAFDAASFEIWAPLLNGARIVIVPNEVLLAPSALRAAIAEAGISIMFVTTGLFREIVRAAPATFARLRYLLVGGEPLDVESVTRLFSAAPPANFRNMYGPTETTTFATYACVAEPPQASAQVPIGRPIVNTAVYVLDAAAKLLPLGAVGELYIGGPGVALGYLNDAALSAAKFVQSSFGPECAGRLYATGDRVRYGADGTLEFLGRADAQLKRRGFRIEPGEIEAVLRTLPEVDDAAVTVREKTPGRRLLVGYVAVGAPATISTESIMRALRARLPTYMLPDCVVALPAFPLNGSGKIDYAALRALALPAVVYVDIEPPTNKFQAQLVALWEKLLDVRPIGIRNNFFDLGGHSLLAASMISEVEALCGERLPLRLLMDSPTIEDLAIAVESYRIGKACDPSPMIVLNECGTAPPLFFLHGSIEGAGVYSLELAKHLTDDRPVYILAPHGVDGGHVPATIEAMAAEYVELIRSVRPHGPYALGGWCNGGLVAFEMARQLRGQNENVCNVILIEVGDANRFLGALVESVDQLRRWFKIDHQRRSGVIRVIARAPFQVQRLLVPGSRRMIIEKAATSIACFARSLFGERRRRGTGARSGPSSGTLLRDFRRVTEAYVPRRYDGKITVMVAENRSLKRMPTIGWSAVAQQVDVRTIRGDHNSCVSDYVEETARELAGALSSEKASTANPLQLGFAEAARRRVSPKPTRS